MIDKEKILQYFKTFTSHHDDYQGAMFMALFGELAQDYRVYFDRDGNLQYKEAWKSFGYRDEVNVKIDERQFIRLALSKKELTNDPFLEVFCYSPNEFLVCGLSNDFPFMINLTLSESGTVAAFYEDVWTTNIEKTIAYIKEFFVKSVKEENIEFGIAAVDASNSLYTTHYDYTNHIIDIEKNYNDDLPYDRLCELLEEEDKSRLILFYGEPGTGKTSLIKHLISKYNETEFIFIDGSLLVNASKEKLMSYFLENQNTVFILEDCEKALADRNTNFNPVMPILLNITDGIIADVLGIKLICTFNCPLHKIDQALLRKGRLSLKYEFKKLAKEKVSNILGHEVDKDMTLAEIYYENEENDFSKNNKTKIGF